MHCSSEFFDTTPKGRILDRCSNDINTIDLVIPMNIRMFMSTAFQVIANKLIFKIFIKFFYVQLRNFLFFFLIFYYKLIFQQII